MGRFVGILGLLLMMGVAYTFSTNRRAIRWKTVAWGLGLQFVFALIVLRWAVRYSESLNRDLICWCASNHWFFQFSSLCASASCRSASPK